MITLLVANFLIISEFASAQKRSNKYGSNFVSTGVDNDVFQWDGTSRGDLRMSEKMWGLFG